MIFNLLTKPNGDQNILPCKAHDCIKGGNPQIFSTALIKYITMYLHSNLQRPINAKINSYINIRNKRKENQKYNSYQLKVFKIHVQKFTNILKIKLSNTLLFD